jgi:bacteriocin-like protein
LLLPTTHHLTGPSSIEDDLRPEKRSRLGRTGGGRPGNDSPSKPVSGPSPSSETAPSKRGPPQLPPIKPIGFAASREARREDGTADRAIPSPVVMGFDFKTIDEEQLKTVSGGEGSCV